MRAFHAGSFPRAAALLCALLAVSCVYPRRGTSLSPVRNPDGHLGAPPDVYAVTVVRADVRHEMRGAIGWDDNGGLPDVYVKFFRDEVLIHETRTVEDTLEPVWDETIPINLYIPIHAHLRIEVWDRDVVGGDPVGIYNQEGLPPQAVPGADANIMLDRGSSVTIRVDRPRPHRGVGIPEYEVQPGALVVTRVLEHSPAGRAGIEVGDQITAIGERRVELMNEQSAVSALSLAQSRQEPLTVKRGRDERVVELDRGYVWLTR